MITGGTVDISPGYYNGVSKSIPVGNVSINRNIVTVSEGYVYDKTLEVGTAVAGGTLIPTTYDMAYPAYSFLTEGLTIKGDANLIAENIAEGKTIFGVAGTHSGSSGAFDVVKVVEYSPYVPAYPEQIGYVFDLDMQWYNYETNVEEPYDASAYEGLYTVTEETKGCTGLGRVFKNINGKYLYAFSYDNWEQATDDSNSAQWCIGDDLGYSPDSGAFIYGDTVSKGTLPNSNSSWNSMMYTVKTCTITTQVTASATEAIPMVLKGSKTESYNTETKEWTDGTIVSTYSEFEIEPFKDWYYASTNGKLIGSSIGSNIQPNMYIPFHSKQTTTATGQVLTGQRPLSEQVFSIHYGVPCINVTDGGSFSVSPVDFLVEGKGGFSISTFLRIDKNEYNGYSICEMYSDKWNKAAGLGIGVEGDKTILIRGGFPKADVDWNYVSNTYIDNYKFPTGKWVHLCFVFYDGYEEYYENGVKIGSRFWNRTFVNTQDKIAVGNNLDQNGFWDGYMSEFKYYPNPISPAQVKLEAERCLSMVTED